ncbi:hypothetical protein PR048_002701 [Dryococelus australis]|uniref:RNA-directed DNA polymerase n=1 Tax=Dryococelus australis TaxID=614101 RepID=A0ABQ9IME4_9NEOP|nr:hypothetical protein PR048_002701 [Dryococelus australis]
MVAERLDCLPPTMAIQVQSPAWSHRIFACGNRARDLPFSQPFHYGAAPYSPVTLISSQDLDGRSSPNLFTHSLTHSSNDIYNEKKLSTYRGSEQLQTYGRGGIWVHGIMAFGKITELNITEPDTWPQCKARFSFFAEANKITDAKQLRATFLMVIGEPSLAMLTSLIMPKELVDASYEELIQVLDSHFDSKKNEIASCFVFANPKQQPTETIAEFVAELKLLSRGCNFQDLEKQLLIPTPTSVAIGVKPNLDMAVKISAAFEAANTNVETISAAQSEVKHVCERSCSKLENVQEECGYVSSTKNANGRLVLQGTMGLSHVSGVVGHIKRVRHSSRSTQGTKAEKSEVYYTDSGWVRREHTRVSEDHYGTLFNVNLSIDQVQAYKVSLQLNGKSHEFEVDSDLGISVQGIHTIEDDSSNLKEYEPLFHEERLPPLKVPPVYIKLKTNAELKILKTRSVAISLRMCVYEALDMLVKKGVLEPTTFSSWATPVVPLPVDDATAEILTLSISKGLMRVRWLPQGLSAVPGVFQQFMEQLLLELQEVAVFLDDVIARTSVQEHDERLKEVLHRITEFLKRESLFCGPLHRLLKGNTTWTFGPTEREVFKNCKTLLQATSVLAHYGENKPLVLTCDASPYGLGAVLAAKEKNGQERPLAFASRTLSDTEPNYGTFDKEGLALVYGVNKFQKYLLGRTFTIFSDHKPLLGVFNQGNPMSSCHYQTWWKEPPPPPHPAHVLLLEAEDDPYDAIEIAAATEADSSLRMVKTWIESGSVNTKDCQTLPVVGKFKPRFNELSLSKGCTLRSNRVVIPQHLQQPILEELHAHHPGIVAMKELAGCYFWWPGLGEDIERVVSECQLCHQARHSRSAVRSSFWTRPTYKWQRLHIDLLEPRNGIQHVQTPPYHPASNGMAERGVQMAKNALRRMSGQNVDCELPRYLLMQRNTPRLSTGKSSAELLVGRHQRTVFHSMHPNHQACKLQQMSPFWKFHPEQRVWERRLTDVKWKPAVVLTAERQMCYKILQMNGVVAMQHVD